MGACILGEEECLADWGRVQKPMCFIRFQSSLILVVNLKRKGSTLWELLLVLITVLLLQVSFFVLDFVLNSLTFVFLPFGFWDIKLCTIDGYFMQFDCLPPQIWIRSMYLGILWKYKSNSFSFLRNMRDNMSFLFLLYSTLTDSSVYWHILTCARKFVHIDRG